MSTRPTFALIVAAGDSRRFEADVPKPYVSLGGTSVLRRNIEAFLNHPGIDGVRVVVRREDHGRFKQATQGLTLFPLVVGGSTRQESVRRGLESLARLNPARVLIHDAARPFIDKGTISRVLDALQDTPGAYPALPVMDTLRDDETIVPREKLLAAQTPQGFHFQPILEAHRRFAGENHTDDIALAHASGLEVSVVDGARANFKLTTLDDFAMMEKLAKADFETRTGMGFDTHCFAEHDAGTPPQRRTVSLCGVKIPHEQKLHGHSDADVALHALVDALLGAIGKGDIGQHFDNTDPQWAGADSSRFLLHAYRIVKERGGDILNIDITIMGEQPKVYPYREQMAQQIAGLLKIERERVNIKATTTEKMGYLGRGEGLAAQVVANVRVPVL